MLEHSSRRGLFDDALRADFGSMLLQLPAMARHSAFAPYIARFLDRPGAGFAAIAPERAYWAHQTPPFVDLQRSGKVEMNPHPSVRGRKKGSKNKTNAEVRELARTYTTVAIKTLATLMLSKESEDLTRYHAAEALLNRGWGRPATAVTSEGRTGPAKVEITWIDHFES